MATTRLDSFDFDLPKHDDCWHLDPPHEVQVRRRTPAAPEAPQQKPGWLTGLEEKRARYQAADAADQGTSTETTEPKDEDPLLVEIYQRVGINARAAWETTKGAGVNVVIFDNGVDVEHPSLSDRVDLNAARDFDHDFSRTGRAAAADQIDNRFNAHGTACAGIVAASELAGVPVVGVAPEARLIPIRISTNFQTESLINALDYARGVADVILMPRYLPKSPELSAKIAAAAQEVPIVCAAGNDGTAFLIYPACLPGTIAVGACNEKGYRSTYSQYGAGLDVVAPSNDLAVEDASVVRLDLDEANFRVRAEEERLARLTKQPPPPSRARDLDALMSVSQQKGWNLERFGSLSIATTDHRGDYGYNDEPAGDFCLATGDVGFGGTSAAASLVAGVIALMIGACLAKHADNRKMVRAYLTPGKIQSLLRDTAYKTTDKVLHPEPGRRTFEVEFGAGLVNAAAAVEAAAAAAVEAALAAG